MTTLDYVGCLRRESARFRDAITVSTLDLPVAGCPGWTVLDLAHHVGEVQRWARLAAVTGARPDDGDIDPPPSTRDVDAVRGWLRDGSDALGEALAAVPDDAPTWHPFPVPKVAAVWPRRQAHEIAIHRWDAQEATGSADRIDQSFATDFVREYFEVIVPRVIDRDGRTAPVGHLAIRLVDTDTSTLVTSTATNVTLGPLEGGSVTGSITGTASDVLLTLWQRQPKAVDATGALAAEWLAFGGN